MIKDWINGIGESSYVFFLYDDYATIIAASIGRTRRPTELITILVESTEKHGYRLLVYVKTGELRVQEMG